MKPNFLLIYICSCLTFFNFISCASSSNKNELVDKGFVTAKSGLFLRENPGKKYAKVTLVPNGEEVKLLEFEKEPQVIDGISARWVRVQYKNLSGWMFSGYLSPEPFVHSIYGTQKPEEVNTSDTYEIGSELNKICPKSNDTYCILNQAIVYYNQRSYKKSVSANTKALEIDPKNSTGLNNRGLSYYKIHEYDLSIKDFSFYIENISNDETIYINRSLPYRSKKLYDKAIADLTRAIKINPQACLAYSSLGWIYLLKKDLELAKQELIRAIDCNPGDAYAYGNLANYYWAAKQDKETALKYIEKSLKAGYKQFDSYYEEETDGQFLQGLNQTKEFTSLIEKYKK